MKADSEDLKPENPINEDEKYGLKKAIIIYAIIEALVLIPLIIYLIVR